MSTPIAFFSDESGAVTVDWTVLSAAAAATALIVLYAWRDEFTNATAAVAIEARGQNMTAGTYRAAMEDYPPYNPVLHERLVNDFSSLSQGALDEMERFVNAYYAQMEPYAETNLANQGLLDDLDYAIGLAYARRDVRRPMDMSPPDPERVGQIATVLGWDGTLVSSAFDGAEQGDPIDEDVTFDFGAGGGGA